MVVAHEITLFFFKINGIVNFTSNKWASHLVKNNVFHRTHAKYPYWEEVWTGGKWWKQQTCLRRELLFTQFSAKNTIFSKLRSLSTSKKDWFYVFHLYFCSTNCTHFYTLWSISETFLQTLWCLDDVFPPGIKIWICWKIAFPLAMWTRWVFSNTQNVNLMQWFCNMISMFQFSGKMILYC